MNKLSHLSTTWKERIHHFKRETYSLYLAYQDPRVPWYAKAFAALVVAYAFSPIDLVPDFIPILGYIDDLILIPFGVSLAVRMIPSEVMGEKRILVDQQASQDGPANWWVAAIVIAIWVAVAATILYTIFSHLAG